MPAVVVAWGEGPRCGRALRFAGTLKDNVDSEHNMPLFGNEMTPRSPRLVLAMNAIYDPGRREHAIRALESVGVDSGVLLVEAPDEVLRAWAGEDVDLSRFSEGPGLRARASGPGGREVQSLCANRGRGRPQGPKPGPGDDGGG